MARKREVPAPAPVDNDQRAFGSSAELWASLARRNDAESMTLTELRDLLLPKLLSGEIRIRDAEKAVEAVL